ncbi:hypothetical protein V6N12_002622 [Hibiscus sabdariffa]|uniref:Wall-associated receptor kinase galacturonan-binding domain-containing protein n=1 Tax=Hibiscus sabdariffa TaxID=183260 RepID=A0ABR2EBD2_9ROSI
MGFHVRLYFILLFLTCPMLQPAESQEVSCGEEICGNVTIPFPFGMHRSCYTSSWFRVSCKQTHDGEKPFISINGMDVEVLGSLFSSGTILVKNPVTYVNCDRTMDRVNLTGTPFFFSTDYNMFGSVGCGNLATIFGNDAEPRGGCIQPVCGVGASEAGAEPGCFNQVFGNFSSTIVNMTAMYPGAKDGSKRCTSAFLFSRLYFHGDDPLAIGNGLNIQTTHVPTTISWNSSYCGDAGCEPGPGLGPINFNGENSCGNITFQYPFQISDQHFSNGNWFGIICKKTSNGPPMPFLNINGMDLQILEFSFLLGNIVVNHSITFFNCRKNNNNGMSLNLTTTPFYYSDLGNVFWSSGCGNLVTVFGNETSNLIGGCLQSSCKSSNESSSATGCPTNVPHGLTSFFVNMSGRVDSSDYSQKRSCGFASIVTRELYYDLTLEPQDFDISNWKHVPISLQWSTPISGMCHLRQGFNTTCTSDQQTCWQSLGSNHLCVCNKDYGIGDVSRLCKGNYCSSRECPLEYEYNSTEFRCEPKTITSLIPSKNTRNWTIIIIGCSTSFGTIFLLLGTWKMYKVLNRRRNIMLKQKYFKKNGGLLLQQHLSNNKNNFEKVKLFTSKEMEKATDYYNENRILGQGGQGTVYKGMLTDGSIVAVKKSKLVKGKKFDEKKVEEFINEENSLFDILDSQVVNDGPQEEIMAVAKLAKRCLHLDGKKRPTMKQVAMELELIKASKEGNVTEQSGDDESEIDEITESWDDVPSCSTTRSITITY